MDTMKVLLGATIALLLGALAVSWQSMKQGMANTPPDEVERLRKQIAELRQEQDNLKVQEQLKQIQSTTPVSPAPSNTELELLKQKIAAQEAAMGEIEQDRKAERDKKLERDEEGLIAQAGLESKDAELKRARSIADALLVARVKEYVKDSQFITFEILMPEVNIQEGTILGIRRKTGILATFKVSGVEAEGGIANPMPGFGNYEPQPGDELILPPQF